MLSNRPLMSNSITQSYSQHRRLVTAIASCADRSVSTILRQPVLEFKLGFLRVEMAG